METVVSRAIKLGRGNKRRIQLVRRKCYEIVSAILFALTMVIFLVLVELFVMSHNFD